MTGAGPERFLVTGALGCIGAWTVRALVREHVPVVAFDLGNDPRRLRLLLSPRELEGVSFVTGDITNLEQLEAALAEFDVNRVIHLAALQVPFCRADPPLGARVNVVGTVNVFEAVKRRGAGMGPVVYTSSIGMYSADDADPATGRLAADATAHPLNHYGVYKLANEGTARIYALDDGVSSVGLRPMTVYGIGRDQGMTSGPTKALVAAFAGLQYTVPFGGATVYQLAEDVARTLILASRSSLTGAHVFNLPGAAVDQAGLVAAIEAELPGSTGVLSFAPVTLPFPSAIDHDGIESLGDVPLTPFPAGVAQTVSILRTLDQAGRLDPAEHGLEVTPSPV